MLTLLREFKQKYCEEKCKGCFDDIPCPIEDFFVFMELPKDFFKEVPD